MAPNSFYDPSLAFSGEALRAAAVVTASGQNVNKGREEGKGMMLMRLFQCELRWCDGWIHKSKMESQETQESTFIWCNLTPCKCII